jgi:hypothetical protein
MGGRIHGTGLKDIFKKGVERVMEVLRGVRKHASPSVRKFLEKHGDEEIVDLKVCRKPIISVIDKLANLITGGRWEQNKEKLSYDKMFHLFALVRLFSGKVYKMEKNHIVEIKSASWNTDSGTETMPFIVTTDMTIGKLLSGAENLVGAERLWVYDARTQNCQFFLKWCLSHKRGWNSAIEEFIMQDAEGVLEGLGMLGKAAKVVTDIAHVADVALNGAGRRRGRGGRR